MMKGSPAVEPEPLAECRLPLRDPVCRCELVMDLVGEHLL